MARALHVYTQARTRWKRLTVFLSYRVDPDLALVARLYELLLGLNLRVWWDKECLKPGQRWEDGFADGLFGSRVFVPVLSSAGLKNFGALDAESETDNLLLEQVCMQSACHQHVISM